NCSRALESIASRTTKLQRTQIHRQLAAIPEAGAYIVNSWDASGCEGDAEFCATRGRGAAPEEKSNEHEDIRCPPHCGRGRRDDRAFALASRSHRGDRSRSALSRWRDRGRVRKPG